MLIALVTALIGCKPTERIVYVESVQTDTLTQYVTKTDTLHVTDSTYVKEYVSGDTVYQVQYKFRDRWHASVSHDSIYIHKTDSIPYPVEVEKVVEVEKELTWWQKTRMGIGTAALVIGLLLLIKFIVKYINRKI